MSLLKRLFLPEIVIPIFLILFFLIRPLLALHDDAIQYHALGISLTHGLFSLDGQTPTMFREPGYPLFLAMVYLVRDSIRLVSVLQALLVGVSIFLWRKIWEMVKPNYGWMGAWGTAIAYGYWLQAGRVGYEALLGTLLASGMYFFLVWRKKRTWIPFTCSAFSFGYLSFTRSAFLFLPLFIIIFVLYEEYIYTRLSKRSLVGMSIGFLVLAFFLPIGWMTRNAFTFGQFAPAERSGVVMYARALTAQASWRVFGTSLASTILGESITAHVWPQPPPLISIQQAQAWIEYDRLKQNHPAEDADVMLTQEAKAMIYVPENASRFIAWTFIEEARLWGLPSLRYPGVSMEELFHGLPLTYPRVLMLLGVDIAQVLWLVLIITGIILLLRTKQKEKLLILLPIFYLAVIHAPLDNVVRFSAPIQPALGACFLYAFYTIHSRTKKSSPSTMIKN